MRLTSALQRLQTSARHRARARRKSSPPRGNGLLAVEPLEDRNLLSAGSLDTSFGDGGLVTTDFLNSDNAQDVAVQGDGKIVVVGESSGGIAMARYNGDGTLDTSFDGDGKVKTDFGSASGVTFDSTGDLDGGHCRGRPLRR